jgi:hypothetical protein
MPRSKTAPPAEVPTIDPHSVYTPGQLQRLLGLADSTVAREKKLGRLRVTSRGGKDFILGEWILEWLRDGASKNGEAAGPPPEG